MGLIFDIIDSVLGSNNGPSNNGFNQEIWDSFNEKLTDALDSDKFEEAESLIKTYYKEYETERDFYYHWYRACTYVRWLESFDASLGIETVKKLQNKAVDALRQSAKFAYDENSDTGNVSEVEELQERYEKVTKEWDDFLSGVDGYNQLQTELDKLIEQQDYIQANSILEEYYIRPSNEKNVDY